MPNLRNIVAIAVPVLTALSGLLWFFSSRKKPKNDEPPDSSTKQNGQNISKMIDDTANSTEVMPGSSNNVVIVKSLEKRQVKEIHKASSKSDVDCLIENTTTTGKINLATGCVRPQKEVETTVQNPLEHVKISDIISVLGNANNSVISEESNYAENDGEKKEEIVNESVITVSETNQSLACPIQTYSKSHQPGGINQLLEQDSVSHELYINSNAEVVSDHDSDNVKNDTNKYSDIVYNNGENVLNINESKSQPLHEESPSVANDLAECVDLSMKLTQNGPKSPVNCQQSENDHAYDKDKNEHIKLTQNVLNELVQKELTESLLNKQTENCDNLSEVSNDSGKGSSVDNVLPSQSDEEQLFEFNIPSDMCGLFIGTKGKTIKRICGESGTRMWLKNHPYNQDYQICVIEGTQSAINAACSIIKMKFPKLQFPGNEADVNMNPVLMPEIMQLNLPEGVAVDVVVSSIIDAGRIFVQQPTHPTFPSLERLHVCMNQCYLQDGFIPDIPRPIESGVICAAPMLGGWYRAQIIATYEATDEADIKYVDYGGYSHISSSCLKQIRSDFMTLPFGAVECYLANITPLAGTSNVYNESLPPPRIWTELLRNPKAFIVMEKLFQLNTMTGHVLSDELYFSTEAATVLEELTRGKMLNVHVVGQADDGIPYVHIYQIFPNNAVVLVNREMVNRRVVRWVELMM